MSGSRTRLTEAQVNSLILSSTHGGSLREIGREFGVSDETVRRALLSR